MTEGNHSPQHSGRDDWRRYPSRPVVCVGAVILDAGTVVLVRRRHAPLAGRWTLPGGALELGETLRQGIAREVLEETGLVVEVGPVVDAVDHLSADAAGRLEYHYVIADYLCRPAGGRLQPGDDVDDAAVVRVDGLTPYGLTPSATAVIQRAVEMYTAWGGFR